MMNIYLPSKTLSFQSPVVMGILNVTPDSFYDGGKLSRPDALLEQAEKMIAEGATILDLGGMSSRPGAEIISEDEELNRLLPALESLTSRFEIIISIDTIRASVAQSCLQAGAHIINDISAGRFDANMIPLLAQYKLPFIIMHMQGMPATMQQHPQYQNVTIEVIEFLKERIKVCKEAGICDLILDPGFGFGKTVEHNYILLHNLTLFQELNLPVLAGVSRKSMICNVLEINPAQALNGTTAVNMIALMNGANILRVHDVKEAMEAIKIYNQLKQITS
ncbi:MAG: dihydropteroate synthase [Chitinophagales bacterium]